MRAGWDEVHCSGTECQQCNSFILTGNYQLLSLTGIREGREKKKKKMDIELRSRKEKIGAMCESSHCILRL